MCQANPLPRKKKQNCLFTEKFSVYFFPSKRIVQLSSVFFFQWNVKNTVYDDNSFRSRAAFIASSFRTTVVFVGIVHYQLSTN